ncbi:hypothetical protein VTK73DRAFT_5475 [Phialemonium thermophilum]|uniref:Molybdate-anion transporter n=1 Tax=Phialemonium thermophilum TaxID=223376 RepID=A0ABR3WN75_9PEZI
MAADWLQGPFLYPLYKDEHHVPSALIPLLFATGFLSGAVSGSFVGSQADKHGRKAACLFFCATYSLSCLMTVSSSRPLYLFAGRALGGLGTSLLFSVFESWMVADFHRRRQGEAVAAEDLSRTFGMMSTLNSVVAIVSGVLSEALVAATGTRKSPFVASTVFLSIAVWVIRSQWEENYGTSKERAEAGHKPAEATSSWTVFANVHLLTLGLGATLFEGSTYLFIFTWTPTLEAAHESDDKLPYGIIFASFMASTLASALIFNLLMERKVVRYSTLLVAILGASALFFLLAAGTTSEQPMFWVFCAFEAAVGMYWPCMGYLKGRLVDDRMRAHVYSLLRIPLNIFVVASLLLNAGSDDPRRVLSLCSKLLFAACGGVGLSFLSNNLP